MNKPIRLSLAASAAASLLGLAACGNNTLDYRNAQINNGKVYAGNANTPFSGKLTNIPANGILTSQQGVQHLASFVGDLGNAAPYGGAVPYSVCDVSIHDGEPDGEVICKPEQSETAIVEGKFTNGVIDGSYTVYDKTSNKKTIEATFRNGALDGKVTVYSPKTEKAVVTANWDAGVLNGEEEAFDETTGNRVFHAMLVNGKYDGEFRRYAPDGKQVIHRVSYVAGKKQGPDDEYDAATGKQIGHADWENGQMNGVVKTWDTNGNLLKQVTFDHGNRIATPEELAAQAALQQQATAQLQANSDKQAHAQAISACISRHHDMFHKQTGTYTNSPSPEKAASWEQQCEQSPDA